MSIGRVFHNEAAAVSIIRLPYFTVLFLLEVNNVSFTDQTKWKGGNRLGLALQTIRGELRA